MSAKTERLEEHLKTHPRDYESVIALYKLKSDEAAKKLKEKNNARLKDIARWRKILEERA